MSQLGIGAMLAYLGGNEKTTEILKAAIGKKITECKLENDELVMKFEDGTGFVMYDDGQSCCERRYIDSDDDLKSYEGTTFLNLEIKDAPSINAEDDWDVHEVQFLEITTDRGVFQLATHNVHNGYYGGFSIIAKPVTI